MHIRYERLHAYQHRGLDVRIAVITEEDTEDFTDLVFRTQGVDKPVAAVDSDSGFDVDFTLAASELDTVGTFRWELVGDFGGEPRTLAQGPLTVSPEPTQEESS